MEISDLYGDEHRTITIGGHRFHWPFPVCWMLNSSATVVLGYRVYGDGVPKWIRPVRRAMQQIQNGIYWIRHRTTDRYHIVKLDMKPHYCDVDERMFLACFSLLGDFVEHELGKPWKDDEDTKWSEYAYRGYRLHSAGGTDEKAIDLWLWYKEDLVEMNRAYHDDYRAFHKRHGYDYIKLKDTKLRELIDLRQTLWT